ncbi:MAG: helicase C-terminal domain-containing protein [Elusimicrobiales bacterium]|nr:helicase C-terminal domain-containing protein [Elusimicrobiales bacterium]
MTAEHLPAYQCGEIEAAVARFFEKDGPVSHAVGKYEERPQQAEMARAVAHSLETGNHLAVEAGTGVGKSLAYLAAASLWALKRGKRVAVATHTKALQEQLVKKDIPGLSKALADLGLEIKAALLMGSENYLCLRRLDIARRRRAGLFDGAALQEVLASLATWGETAGTGLRQEIPFRVPDQIWEAARRETELCAGRGCPWRDSCLWRMDVARARQAQIVVVNQHLFFAGMCGIAWDAAVIDEAHNMDEVAAQYLGVSLSNFAVKRLLDGIYSFSSRRGSAARLVLSGTDAGRAVADAVSGAAAGVDDFYAALARAAGLEIGLLEREGRCVRVTEPGIARDALSPALEDVARALSAAVARAADMEEELALKAARDKALGAAAAIRRFLKCEGRRSAYWIEARALRARPFISLEVTPLDVSELLAAEFFGLERPVVMTSATLAVDGGFSYFRKRVGVEDCLEKIISSPFNYEKQAGLFLAADMPAPREDAEAYETAAVKLSREIIQAADGGVFVLFSSWSFLQKAARLLSPHLAGRKMFIQGDSPPSALVREFRKAGDAVLFATDTFWQGVDVPGSALSCVIITRLPFMAPDSPVEQARAEWYAFNGRNIFAEYTLPRAVIKFHQGFGRLIRRKSDRGVVAVLDPRILSMHYGSHFLRAIPQCKTLGSPEEIRGFFRRD